MSIALNDVRERKQLTAYYKERGLEGNDEKIKHLIFETGLMAIRGSDCNSLDSSNESLALLEESVTLGHWRSLK